MNQKILRREFVMLAGSGVAAIALGSPLLARSAGAVSTRPDALSEAVLDEFASFKAPPLGSNGRWMHCFKAQVVGATSDESRNPAGIICKIHQNKE